MFCYGNSFVKRALPDDELLRMATEAGLKGISYPTVVDAMKAAKENCLPKDIVFVGGSNQIRTSYRVFFLRIYLTHIRHPIVSRPSTPSAGSHLPSGAGL